MEPATPPSSGAEPPPLPPPAPKRILPGVFRLLGPMLAALVLGCFIDGELGHFLTESWAAAPFAVLCVLAYAGLDRPVARVLSWLLLFAFLAVFVFLNVIFTLAALHDLSGGKDLPDTLPVATVWRLLTVGGLSVLAALTALLPLSGAWRRLCSLLAGAGEWTSVRILALATVSSLSLVICVPLLVLGEPPLLLLLRNSSDPSAFLDPGRGIAGLYLNTLYDLCRTLVAAALAVGYGVRRDWGETLARLGLRRITLRETGLAVALTGLLLGLVHFADKGIAAVWQNFHWPVTDMDAFTVLLAPFITPVGAVVIGITAGVGEEVAVRGILQPRLGILLSNVFFTSLHASQYHWDGLAIVFLIGLALGFIRKKTSTSVSAIVHGSYDFVLILYAFLSGEM